MPPTLVLFLWVLLLLALLWLDPAQNAKTSKALWIPVVWLFIEGSRLPSQWINPGGLATAQSMEDGNPLDRVIFLVLILLAIGVLFSRSFSFSRFVARNTALNCLLLFALLSVLWSDFPFVVFKRWIRDCGTYLVTLVVLTDRSRLEAITTVLRRLAYILLPLSIVLDRYFIQLSRQYDGWTGTFTNVGVTTSKNMLGLLCLVSGLFFLWDTITRWPQRRQRQTKRILAVNVVFLALSIWLLQTAKSTTSTVCLVLGSFVILVSQSTFIRRRPGILKTLIPASFCVYLLLDFVFGLNGSMAQAVGKDPTLTDRTKIWTFLLGMHTNPFIGTGYQSFWLGSRLEYFWNASGEGHINEAHNGFLEVYLELGLIGIVLLIGFLIASYRTIYKRLTSSRSFAVFGLAVWLVLVFYNMSEAAFEAGLMYALFLMVAVAAPERTAHRVGIPNVVGKDGASAAGRNEMSPRVARLSIEPAARRDDDSW